jgi:hypothetical protein
MRRNVPDEVKATPKMEEKSSKYVPFEENFEPTQGINTVAKKPTTTTRRVSAAPSLTSAQRANLKGRDDVEPPEEKKITPKVKFNAITSSNEDAARFKETMDKLEAEKSKKTSDPVLSSKDMKRSIGFSAENAGDIVPVGTALQGIRRLSSELIKKGADKKLKQEAMDGGFSYADKLARDAKAPPDIYKNIVNKKNQARDYLLNKLPKNSIANKTEKIEKSGAMKGEINPSELRPGFNKGGKVRTFKQGGSVSASSRGDGIATKGRTRGKFC